VSIEEERRRLDEIDSEVARLLNERAKHVAEIGRIKAEQDSRVYVPEREKEVIERIREENDGPLPNETLETIFKEIVSAMRSSLILQRDRRSARPLSTRRCRQYTTCSPRSNGHGPLTGSCQSRTPQRAS